MSSQLLQLGFIFYDNSYFKDSKNIDTANIEHLPMQSWELSFLLCMLINILYANNWL